MRRRAREIREAYLAQAEKSWLHALIFGLPVLACSGLGLYLVLGAIHWVLYGHF